MKVIEVLAFIGLVALSQAVDPETPAEILSSPVPECPASNGQEVTLLPNSDDCGTYYACDNGLPILMNCPPGLHFNNKWKACDYPASACCDLLLDPEHKCDEQVKA